MALRQAVEDAFALEERRKRRASPKSVYNPETKWMEEMVQGTAMAAVATNNASAYLSGYHGSM
jgi:hypothetical protein